MCFFTAIQLCTHPQTTIRYPIVLFVQPAGTMAGEGSVLKNCAVAQNKKLHLGFCYAYSWKMKESDWLLQ